MAHATLGDHCSVCNAEFTRLSGNRLGCAAHGIVKSREEVNANRVIGIRKHCNDLETRVVPVLEFSLAGGLQAIIHIARSEAARLAKEES